MTARLSIICIWICFIALLIIGIAMVTILFNLDNAGGEAGHLGGAIMGLLIMTVWKWRIISRHRRNGL